MDWLTNNFIANMYGPSFLLLYIVTIAAALMLGKNFIRSADTTDREPSMPPPSKPDPYELAYLRGGEQEVIRLTVFRLVQTGRLTLADAKSGKIARADGPAHLSEMSDMERTVYKALDNPETVRGICRRIFPKFMKDCAPLERHLRERRLLVDQSVIESVYRVRKVVLAVILGLGGYKLAVALSRGRANVLFLIILAVVGCILTIRKLKAPRLSRRGEDYLKQLQAGLEDEKNAIGADSQSEGSDLTLFVALFGFGVLAGTPFAGYMDILPPAVASADKIGRAHV
jgi:uncharacterized protein (TIGR04222 family)